MVENKNKVFALESASENNAKKKGVKKLCVRDLLEVDGGLDATADTEGCTSFMCYQYAQQCDSLATKQH